MDTIDIVQDIAKTFIERAQALGYNGKKRDEAALNYFLGAAAVARACGNEALYQRIGTLSALLIATRGYAAVVETANGIG